jgi:hypothetical protein
MDKNTDERLAAIEARLDVIVPILTRVDALLSAWLGSGPGGKVLAALSKVTRTRVP